MLRGFSLHVPEGNTAALVGGSGCGKSTVVKIIQRFYEMAGGKVSIVLVHILSTLFVNLSNQTSIYMYVLFLDILGINVHVMYSFFSV